MTHGYRGFGIVFGVALHALVGVSTAQVIPRSPLPKMAAIVEPVPPATSRLVLKFRDELKVRAVAENVTSLVGADLSAVEALQTQYGLSF